MPLTTPRNKAIFVTEIVILWCLAPLVILIVTWHNQSRGVYPPAADTILIPLGNSAILWLIGIPYLTVLLWFSTRNYRVSRLLDFRRSRRELLAVAFALPGSLTCLFAAFLFLDRHHWLVSMVYFLNLYWFLTARAVISAGGQVKNQLDVDSHLR